jgi:hypothetical protein
MKCEEDRNIREETWKEIEKANAAVSRRLEVK